jgi:hypothetical protein
MKENYKTVTDNAMSLQDWNCPLGMVVVVVVDKVVVGHAMLLLDVDGGLDDFPEASGIRVTCFEMAGHHDGEGEIKVRRIVAALW